MPIVYLQTESGNTLTARDGGQLYVGDRAEGLQFEVGAYSAEAWAEAMRGLMPEGEAWDYSGNLGALLDAQGEEFSRADGYIDYALKDQIPFFTTEKLPDWEKVLGLPDPCIGTGGTVVERREMVLDRLSPFQGFAPATVTIRAWNLGFVIRIDEPTAWVCGESVCDDPLDTADMENAFIINLPTTTVRRFKCGVNKCGEKFRTWGNPRLSCWIDRIKHTHTDVWYSYDTLLEE